jgi:hypothetical protein
VEFGFAAMVDTELMAAITTLEPATTRKNGGRAVHIGGTAGISAMCKLGTATVRKLHGFSAVSPRPLSGPLTAGGHIADLLVKHRIDSPIASA